jgi:hypothetical protein
MLARGFRGRFRLAAPVRFRAVDALFLLVSTAACVGIRLAV